MRKIFSVLSMVLLLCGNSFAQRTGTMKIRGVDCEYDTLVHYTIGPGATYTQFQFNNLNVDGKTYKMRTHLLAIDMKNPNNVFNPYLSKGEFYSVSTQSNEVKRRKEQLGLKPIASLNGAGFFNNVNEGQSTYMYELDGSVISNREIYYETQNSHLNCWVDGNRKVHVGYSEMKGSVVTASGDSLPLAQVNHFRQKVNAKKYVSLFCNGIPRTQSSVGTGVDVIIRKKDGSKFTSGRNACIVESVLDGTWHDLESTQAGLSADGDMGENLKSMIQAGDEIVVNIDYQEENGTPIDMVSQCTNFIEECVWHGEPAPNTRRGMARSAIGTSMNEDTCYWADMEISTYSNCPEICAEDFLANVGVYNAMWLDGGPSAEMTVGGSYVTTNSIGQGFNGRLIPGGFMLYSVAPDDPVIAKVDFKDPTARTVALGSQTTVSLYGYNQYDEIVNSTAETSSVVQMGVTNNLGTISKGVFTATKEGEGFITVKLTTNPDQTIYLPLTVVSNKTFSVSPKTLFTGNERKCQAKVRYMVNGESVVLDPSQVQWTATNPNAIADCTAGLIAPLMDGFSYVIADYNGYKDTISVTVENLEEEADSVDFSSLVSSGSRQNIHLTSVPYWFCAKVSATDGATATLGYTANGVLNTVRKTVSATDTMIVILDYDDLEQYPVKVTSINGATLTGLVAHYTPYHQPTGIASVRGGSEPFSVTRSGNGVAVANTTTKAQNVEISIYTTDGQTIGTRSTRIAAGSEVVLPVAREGVVFVTVKTADTVLTKKVF